MWGDEIYFEDDEAAMAAYRAAVGETGSASNNEDDDDNDFIPSKPSRRGVGSKSRRELPPKSKKISSSSTTRKALTKPRKPRVSAASRSSSPAPVAAVLKTADNTDEDGDVEIDIDDTNESNLTAMPTPDIGKLSVSAASGVDEGESPSAMLGSLREREQSIRQRILQLEKEIAELEKKCGVEGATEAKAKATEIDLSEFKAPEWSVPIRANVMNFDWEKLASACQFD
ncbi:hypothetical protein LPJ57_008992, partial [Coemansia sp. RSA 486]